MTQGHFTNSSVHSRTYTAMTGSFNTKAAKKPSGTAWHRAEIVDYNYKRIRGRGVISHMSQKHRQTEDKDGVQKNIQCKCQYIQQHRSRYPVDAS